MQKDQSSFWGEPLDSPPLDGIEEFTIKEVGNPIIVNGFVDRRIASALIDRMQKLLFEKSHKSQIQIKRRSFSRVVSRPHLVATTDKFGRVEMKVQMSSAVERVESVAQMIVDEIYRSCEYDLTSSLIVLDRFWVEMVQEDFKAPELMSTLLVVMENIKKEEDGFELGTNKPKPMVDLIINIDEIQKENKREALRFVSVRQMLRYYFQRHPRNYKKIIMQAIGNKFSLDEKIPLKYRIKSQIAKQGVRNFVEGIYNKLREDIRNREMSEGDRETEDMGVSRQEIEDRVLWDISEGWNGEEIESQIDIISEMIARQITNNREGRK
jgi:hypothetical protein